MFKGIKNNNLMSLRKVLTILLFVMFFIPKNVFAYTVTYNANGALFDNGQETNVVTYNDNHGVVSGEYKKPEMNNPDIYELFWSTDEVGKKPIEIDMISSDTTVYAQYSNVVWNYGYTGGEQTFTLPYSKYVRYELWGAEGGKTNDSLIGAYGGYSSGFARFNINTTIFINNGEAGGITPTYTYNGGGIPTPNTAQIYGGAGGGATHIATISGLLSELVDNKDKVLVVAGGAGGSTYNNESLRVGGSGGGFQGQNGLGLRFRGNGGTQTAGGANQRISPYDGRSAGFGIGGNAERGASTPYVGGGGGAGWYGGSGGGFAGDTQSNGSGGGGSGYIASADIVDGVMYGYDVPTSDEPSTLTYSTDNYSDTATSKYAKQGNGYTRASIIRPTITYKWGDNEESMTVVYREKASINDIASSRTVRTGYNFVWQLNGVDYDFDTPVTEDITLVGVYTPKIYNITYNVTDGTVSDNPDTYNIESDTITLNNPTPDQDEYMFAGWTGTGLTKKTMTVTIPKGSIGDREYTAHFEKEKYTITYNLNGGELETGVTNPEEYYVDSPDITLNNPIKEGYTFIGWTGSNGTTPSNVIIPTGSKGNKTYTANYQIDRHTATFDSNLGTTAVPETITKDYNEALGTLPTTSRIGYIFEGWFTERDGGTQISSTTKMSAQEVRYYAHWTPITYTIHFNSNNGTGSMSDETMTYGVSKALTENSFTKDGWTFAGWNTKADGSGTNYIDKQKIFNLTDVDGKEFTLFAKWTKDEYIITYNADGGQLENPKTTYSVDDEEFTLVQPTKEGYTFTGWTGTGVTNPTKNVVIPTGSTGNRDYTAHWTTTVYTIEYINNVTGETVLVAGNPTSYTVEDSDIPLNNAGDYDTYHFYVGWTSDKDTEYDLSDSYVIRTNQMKNLKIYAIYQTSPYTVSFDSDGGNNIDPISRQGTEDIGPLPIPVKEGYIFKGWFVNNKLIDQTFHSRVDVTAIAKWEKISTNNSVNPKTGDNIMKYLMLLIISIIGLGYTVLKFKLKTKKVQ